MPNEFSVRLVPAKMAGVVSPRGGGGAGRAAVRAGKRWWQRPRRGRAVARWSAQVTRAGGSARYALPPTTLPPPSHHPPTTLPPLLFFLPPPPRPSPPKHTSAEFSSEMLLQALRKPKKGLGVARRKEVDDCVFRLRDGKQAARALAHLDQAHTFDVGPRAAGTRDWLLRAFRQFAEGETTPPDQTLIRFVWGRLRGVSSLSVADYCGRLLKALAAEGETGYRTRRVLAVKRALTRFGALLRPSQAPPVDVDAVMDVVEAFGREGAERERAFVALVWMARARMADARYLLVRDLVEVTDEGATGLEIALKEKQQKSWTPVVYLPPGTLTQYVVECARARRLAEGQDAPLFAATETQYQRLMCGLYRQGPGRTRCAGGQLRPCNPGG